MDIPAYGERNLARNQEENNKKLLWGLAKSEREKVLESLKKWFEQVKSEFLKTLFSKFD